MNGRTRRNLVLVAVVGALAVGAAAFGLATRAIASSNQQPAPFNLVGSAQTGPVSKLDPAASAALARFAQSAPSGSGAAEQILTAAYALPSGIGGHPAYLVPSQTGELCFFVNESIEGCGPPLTSGEPVRIGVFDRASQDAVGPTVFGLAADGVRSVTFALGGAVRTVAVRDNLFEFDAPASVTASDVTDVTATSTDGHTTAIG